MDQVGKKELCVTWFIWDALCEDPWGLYEYLSPEKKQEWVNELNARFRSYIWPPYNIYDISFVLNAKKSIPRPEGDFVRNGLRPLDPNEMPGQALANAIAHAGAPAPANALPLVAADGNNSLAQLFGLNGSNAGGSTSGYNGANQHVSHAHRRQRRPGEPYCEHCNCDRCDNLPGRSRVITGGLDLDDLESIQASPQGIWLPAHALNALDFAASHQKVRGFFKANGGNGPPNQNQNPHHNPNHNPRPNHNQNQNQFQNQNQNQFQNQNRNQFQGQNQGQNQGPNQQQSQNFGPRGKNKNRGRGNPNHHGNNH